MEDILLCPVQKNAAIIECWQIISLIIFSKSLSSGDYVFQHCPPSLVVGISNTPSKPQSNVHNNTVYLLQYPVTAYVVVIVITS
jgi:hypothetical protein